MQALLSPTNIQSGRKRTRAQDIMDTAALHCTDNYSIHGKPSKRCRPSGDQHLQQYYSTSATIRKQSERLVANPGRGSKGHLRMQHFMPSPTVLNMYQPFLRQLAAGIAAGLAAGADSNDKDSNRATEAVATMPELQLPALQEAGIDITALFQPMVQMLLMMTAGAHSASIQHSNTAVAASRGISVGVQGNIAGTSVGAVPDRGGNKSTGLSVRSKASKSLVAKVPVFNPAEPAAAEDVDQAAVAAAGAATAAAAGSEAIEATEDLQVQHPFVYPLHRIPASPDVWQQQPQPQQVPAGTWMSSSSSSAISSSWAGPVPEIKSPTTSITGIPPRPASTSSKQQHQQQQRQQHGLLSPAGLQLTSSGNTPWSVSPSCSAIAASAGLSAAGGAGTTAAVGGVRVAPGPEDSQAINMHRQRIMLLERQLGNMHPEVGQAYLKLAQALTQEGSMWSLAMSERARHRAAQILEGLRQRTAANSSTEVEASATVPAPPTEARAAVAAAVAPRATASTVAVLDVADAYVYITANQHQRGAAAKR